MEKFGIFNILSALNSLTNGGAGNKQESTNTENKEKEKKNADTKPNLAPPEFPMSSKPMLDLLARHDEIAKRIDKNNKK